MTLEDLIKLNDKRNRGKAAPTEHDLQKACIMWFRYIYPNLSRLLMAIPNGARRTLYEQRMVKEEGIQAGTPDIFLAVPCNGYHGLWIEMKNGKAGRVSDFQKDMLARLSEQGYMCKVCRTLDEFTDAIVTYLGK